ncbi:MAG: pimeloyl-ACP methyl ester esterase BioH [Burkholderiales bacterium]
MTIETDNLVFLHGWGMHSGVWNATAERLSARFNVTAVNLPGYGGKASVAPYTLETLAASIAAELPPVFDLCGWSLGGQLALTLARLLPDRVRRLVLVGTNPCFTRRPDWPCAIEASVLESFSCDLTERYEATLKRFLALQVHGDAAARQTLAHLRGLLFAQGKPDGIVLSNGLDILLNSDLRGEIAGIAVPALVMHGGSDRLVPVCAAEWLAQTLPQGRLQRFSGASHALFLSHPAEFDAAIIDFLQEQY